MSPAIAVTYRGHASRFSLTAIDHKTLHGFKRRIALDEQGQECATALLTREGSFLLPAGATGDVYLDAAGDTVKKSELVAVDAKGTPLPTLLATLERPQAIEGPITLEAFLNHVAVKVYALEAEALDAMLEEALRAGAIFRVPFRPRATHAETPAFLLANEHGVFLVQGEPCHFEFVGLEQQVSEGDEEHEDEEMAHDEGEFSFERDWEAAHAVA